MDRNRLPDAAIAEEFPLIKDLIADGPLDTHALARALKLGLVEALHIDNYWDVDSGRMTRVSLTLRPSRPHNANPN